MGWRHAIAVVGLTFAVWIAGARGPYHFDDAITPLADPASQSLGAWARSAVVTLRPVAKLSYAIEGSLGLSEHPAARRATTIAVHAAAALLLAMVLLRLVPALGATGASLLALVWAVHPIHAEAVLAVAGRPAALANACVLAALLATIHARDRTAAALLLVAVLCRETALAAVVPLVVATRGRSPRWLVAAAVVGAAWIAWTPRYQELAAFSYREIDPVAACTAQLAAVPVGLSLLVRPWALAIDHGGPLPEVLALGGLAIYAIAIAVIVIGWRRAPVLALGIAVWLAAIAPTQSFVPKLDALTERPLSLAWAGLIIAVAGWWRWRPASALVAAALALATLVRGQRYASDVALWADAAAKSPHGLRPHWNYAQALQAAGRFDDARAEFLVARAIAPHDVRIEAALERLARPERSP
jgi:hypothetical protein